MARTLEQVKQDALALEPEDQRLLAEYLSDHAMDDEENDPAWRTEIRRRIKEIDEGNGTLLPWDDLIAELRERLSDTQSLPEDSHEAWVVECERRSAAMDSSGAKPLN